MEFTFFNVTNSEKVKKDPNVPPELVEMGPYVFREYHRRENVTWNDNNTVTYRQVKTWFFEEEMSNGNLSDMVTNFNVIATTTAYATRFSHPILQRFVSRIIDKANATLLVTRSVSELLFEGYEDPLLDVAHELNSTLFVVPFEKFGYFVDRNDSVDYDGWFNMFTGQDDIKKLGLHYQWNFMTNTPYYDFPCNEVSGSTGEIWPPLPDYSDVEIFAPDICTSLKLTFNKHTEFAGAKGLEYVGTTRSFDNGSLFPETRCQCVGECVPTGALNISLCRWNAPMVVTMPHFYLADPIYLTYSRGLQPDARKHELQFALDPFSGIPLYANARLQLNIMMEAFPHIKLFAKLKQRVFVPTMWFNQRVVLTEDLAPLINLLSMAPQLGAGIFFALAGVGALLLLAALLCSLRPLFVEDEETEKLLAAEDDPAATIDRLM